MASYSVLETLRRLQQLAPDPCIRARVRVRGRTDAGRIHSSDDPFDLDDDASFDFGFE